MKLVKQESNCKLQIGIWFGVGVEKTPGDMQGGKLDFI